MKRHQTFLRHFQKRHLVGGAETVFHTAQNAVILITLSLKIHHHIHHMFQQTGAGDDALLGDMAGDHHGDLLPLGQLKQFRRTFADLSHTAADGIDALVKKRLNGVNDQELR